MSKHIRALAFMVIVGVLLLFGLTSRHKPNEEKIAKIFYEEHYYKVLHGAYGDNLGKHFENRDNSEISVNLEDLVIYNSEVMNTSLDEINCNLMKSKLIITPKSPYGPKDYKYIIECVEP